MTAVESLARGKVVLSGAEPEALKYAGALDCPIVNARPDPVQIHRQLVELVEDEQRLEDLGRRGRAFAERFHALEAVTPRYLQIWERFGGPRVAQVA
jgi:hypothetical protein